MRRALHGFPPRVGSVSIHAPWEGCDSLGAPTALRVLPVSIHAPWEGCDWWHTPSSTSRGVFQFTHPGKGATTSPAVWIMSRLSFNSRTLGRVRPNANFISWYFDLKFQFTHPGKGATISYFCTSLLINVSIHAPWEGCDLAFLVLLFGADVSIHAPWEGCDWCTALTNCYTKSVSIHAPWEGCDDQHVRITFVSAVSIHAPWEGCD